GRIAARRPARACDPRRSPHARGELDRRSNRRNPRSLAMIGVPIGIAVVLVLVAFIAFNSLRILREYQRAVVFQLGRFWKVKGPGLVILIPGIQQMVRVDLRVVVMDVPSQDVISRDNVSVKVNAVLYFRVVDPQKAIIQVENYLVATSQLAQTTLR